MKSKLLSDLWPETLFTLVAVLFSINFAIAKPRPPSPPWPEMGMLHYESFDYPCGQGTNYIVDPSTWAESWSGYALNRTSPSVAPFAVPVLAPTTNLGFNIDAERGAIRFWYQPDWSGGWTGVGKGPGTLARLLTLVTTNQTTEVVWWSLVVSPDGNELHLVCETAEGPVSCLSALINWEAGSWHALAVGYSATNSALFVDDQTVAVGDGLPTLPGEVISRTALVVGSDLSGRDVARGQIDELATFTGRSRFRGMAVHPFGMGTAWDIEFYYSCLSPHAAKGPITPEEEAAQRARAAAWRAERVAAEELASAMQSLDEDDGGFQLDSYDPEQGFWLLTPEIQQGTNVFLTLVNCDTNIGYDIYYTPAIETNMTWSILATGHVGQTTFTVPTFGWQGFYRGSAGSDWDGDTIPNWMDADPKSTNTGALSITIDSPTHGAVFQ